MNHQDELPEPRYRKFRVVFSNGGLQIAEGVIALHEGVINAVDDEWRSVFYDLNSPEEIADHIAYNICINNLDLHRMDGFADQPAHFASMLEWPDLGDWSVSAKEIE